MMVSIITVCFNSEKTISANIRSVAKQSYNNFEHIIIDGGSSDTTLKKIESSLTSPNTTVISEPDRGIYDAMNKGLRLANGEVICFLNSDDVFADDLVLATVVCGMKEYGCDLLYGDVDFFKDSVSKKTVRHYSSKSFKPEKFAWGWMPAHPSVFLRAKIYQDLGGFVDDFKIAGDFEFLIRVFSFKSIKYRYLNTTLVKMKTGGMSSQSVTNRLLINREILRACRINGVPSNWAKILLRYFRKILEYRFLT